jgi:uncharacterized protein YutE (UPF0331/DUF86 family)
VDAATLTLLESDLTSQLSEILKCYAKIRLRTDNFAESEERLESLAYQLHNLYCAFEELFQTIAEAFENQIGTGAGWHVELLSRMRRSVPGVRPGVIDDVDYRALNELRAFRHVFRHAYALELNPQKLRIVLDQGLALESRADDIVAGFIASCREQIGTE